MLGSNQRLLQAKGTRWAVFASRAAAGHLRRGLAAENSVFIFSLSPSHRLDLLLRWKAVTSVFLCINVFLFGQVSQFIPAAKSWPSGWNFPQHLQEPGAPDPLFLAPHIFLTPHSNFQKFYLKRPKTHSSFYCS